MKYRGHSSGDYVVWDVWNQTEETAYRVDIASEEDPAWLDMIVRQAAEQGAEMMHGREDYFESTDVCVKDLKTGKQWLVSVDVEMIPSFRSDDPRLLEGKTPEEAAKDKIIERNEKASEASRRFREHLEAIRKKKGA